VTDKLIRPLTPHEVRALQKPAVQEMVRFINVSLLRGERSKWINKPLVDDVRAALRPSLWDLRVVADMGEIVCCAFEPIDDTATAEAIGAELTGQVKA
jgi:hypothetical protein